MRGGHRRVARNSAVLARLDPCPLAAGGDAGRFDGGPMPTADLDQAVGGGAGASFPVEGDVAATIADADAHVAPPGADRCTRGKPNRPLSIIRFPPLIGPSRVGSPRSGAEYEKSDYRLTQSRVLSSCAFAEPRAAVRDQRGWRATRRVARGSQACRPRPRWTSRGGSVLTVGRIVIVDAGLDALSGLRAPVRSPARAPCRAPRVASAHGRRESPRAGPRIRAQGDHQGSPERG
jgi:hypothetical protein